MWDGIFKAKIDESIIYVYAVGKWRPIRHYAPKYKIPSAKIQKEVLHSVWLNTGKRFDLDKVKLKFITTCGFCSLFKHSETDGCGESITYCPPMGGLRVFASDTPCKYKNGHGWY